MVIVEFKEDKDKDVRNKDGVFIVKKLKERLPFNCVSVNGDFVDVTGKERWNHEGVEWIKITGLKRGYEDLCYDTFKKLKGKTIALIYPNSD